MPAIYSVRRSPRKSWTLSNPNNRVPPMTKPLNIGMIGYGFMGRAHSNAFPTVKHSLDQPMHPVMKAACARDAGKLKAFADKWGYASTETDWRKLVERKDIDAIDICVPNNLHKEIALAAAANKKMILCEKPLAMNGAEGKERSEEHTSELQSFRHLVC